jgi:hypothetical protein
LGRLEQKMGTVTSLRREALNQPLEIITWRQNQDLREVSQAEDILWYWVKDCKLRNGQAALFSNKAEDRFRIVARYNDMPMLIILPVAVSYQLRRQLYAKIAEWVVHGFTTRRGVANELIEIDLAA